ncbi:hypothetical protein AVEN_144274-1 [Araneus ventricosus]|uniref:Uncharacterized protein n=1 Tax=Araneus ventricosus TaxID=182803 RepID=A0A4Y2H9Q8_ARAVE|nr:hypothetical protein AVEN_144274-1 [Araneus ventricosus]
MDRHRFPSRDYCVSYNETAELSEWNYIPLILFHYTIPLILYHYYLLLQSQNISADHMNWVQKSKVQFDYNNFRFEAAGGLFWDGPRHFEPRSDDEDDI